MLTALDVIEGRADFAVECADAVAWMEALPADCASLCFFSPPYTGARLYLENGADLGIARNTEEWVAWMVRVFRAALRVTTGLVACVCDDQTKDYRYGCGPQLLMADLCRAGFNLRRPCVYRRSGIPGSGGPDWFRCDHELIICATRPGRLPWSDTTACGHPPKWAPGGEMSHRLSDGQRVNQWGKNGGPRGMGNRNADGSVDRRERPSHKITTKQPPADGTVEPEVDMYGEVVPEKEVQTGLHHGGNFRSRDGTKRPSKPHTKAKPNGTDEQQNYTPPVLANPGTIVQRFYTAEEVAELLGYVSDVVDCAVGGGQMGEGDKFSRLNEAPFPEELAERFVRSFAPPGSVVIDPFAGSGTTARVARRWGRRSANCDIRESQCRLTRKSVANETPFVLFQEPS